MELTVFQPELTRALTLVGRAVSSRRVLPVLAHLLLVARQGRLQLAGTDLELFLTTWLDAEVVQPGAVTIPARLFTELVNTLPAEDIRLTLDTPTQTLCVQGPGSTTHLKGLDTGEFPPLPQSEGQNRVHLSAAEWKTIIRQVTIAASTDEARPALTGVLVKFKGDQATFATADGFRLAVRTMPLPITPEQEGQWLVPARALLELGRALKDSADPVELCLPAEGQQVLFRTPEFELATQLLDAAFPDYEAVIPTEPGTQTVIQTEAFLKACQQAEIFARESSNIAQLELSAGRAEQPGNLKVFAQADETGCHETCLEARVEGPPLHIAFNVRFLRDVLEVIQTPHVVLETNQPNMPGLLRPQGEEGYRYVLMPMHTG